MKSQFSLHSFIFSNPWRQSHFWNIVGHKAFKRTRLKISRKLGRRKMHFPWCDMKRTLYILMLFLYFSNEDSMMLNVLLRKLHYISGLNELISQTCDTSFLYWHRQLIPVYFDYLFESKVEAYRLNVSLTASLIITFAYFCQIILCIDSIPFV